jgi:hypothetical protein
MTEEEKTNIITEIDAKVGSRLADTTKEILDAVTSIMDKKMQEFGVRQDAFEDKMVGLIKDLNSSHSQSESLREHVEIHEEVIKTNILPRLNILEKAS